MLGVTPDNLALKSYDIKPRSIKSRPHHNPTRQKVLQEQAPMALWTEAASFTETLLTGHHHAAVPFFTRPCPQTLSPAVEVSTGSQPALMPIHPWG